MEPSPAATTTEAAKEAAAAAAATTTTTTPEVPAVSAPSSPVTIAVLLVPAAAPAAAAAAFGPYQLLQALPQPFLNLLRRRHFEIGAVVWLGSLVGGSRHIQQQHHPASVVIPYPRYYFPQIIVRTPRTNWKTSLS
jgi:hypothetical protein